MPRLPTLLAALVIGLTAGFAQEGPLPATRQPRSLLTELNRDIWTPYTAAFNTQEPEKYLGLLAPDFVRIEGDQLVIRPRAEYVARLRRSFDDWKDRDLRPEFEFRFTERIVRGSLASERGIYQFVLYDPEGNTERYFGTFHLLARKIDDAWKITVEYDSNEEGSITRTEFLRAAALTDFSRF